MEFSKTLLFVLIFGSTLLAIIATMQRDNDPLLWEGIDLEGFESPTVKDLYKMTGYYKAKNMVALKAASRMDRLYLLTPRMREGVPCSLVSLDVRQTSSSPKFYPYPDLASHELGNCKAIQNAIDIFLDSMGNLWVLDSGTVNTLVKSNLICSPKVVCISTITNRITRVIELSAFIKKNANLQKIVVDYDRQRRPYLYISDSNSCSILVYNVEAGNGYHVILPEQIQKVNDPKEVLFLSLIRNAGRKNLYFTYFSSPKIYAINSEDLLSGKNSSKIKNVASKPAPLSFLGTDSQSKIYFRYHNDPAIYSWDVSTKFDPESLQHVYTNDGGFLATDVFVDGFRGLKVLESNYPDFINGEYGCGVYQQIAEIPRE